MADITLYGASISTFVRTARMTLLEKGAEFKYEQVPPHGDVINTLNPFGRIPALRDGDFVLFETPAICRYLDRSLPGPKLIPADARAEAVVEQWISATSFYLYDSMIRRFVIPYVFPSGPDGKPDRSVIDAALPDVREHLGILDRAYGARNWLAGDSMTLADLFVAPLLFYVGMMAEGPDLLAPHANVRRAFDTMAARASFQGTMPEL